MAETSSLTRQYTLRGMDSVQLAAALAARHMAPAGTTFLFVCVDDNLCQAAQTENFDVINPLPRGACRGCLILQSTTS